MADASLRHTLGDRAARQLANTTKTAPQMGAITPRWLVRFLAWRPVESGTFRVNRVRADAPVEVTCGAPDEGELPGTFVDYEEQPREHTLSLISTVLDVHTRISDLYSHPHDQVREQLRLAVESVKERQESELVNNEDYGLLKNVAPSMKVQTRGGAPTPDDSTNCSRVSGKSRRSSSHIREPSPHSAANARDAACLRRPSRSSARSS